MNLKRNPAGCYNGETDNSQDEEHMWILEADTVSGPGAANQGGA